MNNRVKGLGQGREEKSQVIGHNRSSLVNFGTEDKSNQQCPSHTAVVLLLWNGPETGNLTGDVILALSSGTGGGGFLADVDTRILGKDFRWISRRLHPPPRPPFYIYIYIYIKTKISSRRPVLLFKFKPGSVHSGSARCNLLTALLADWPGSLTCHCGNGWRVEHWLRVSTES